MFISVDRHNTNHKCLNFSEVTTRLILSQESSVRSRMDSGSEKDVSVAVIGGGLVGSLQACVLAKKGYREVHLYEVSIFLVGCFKCIVVY